MIWNQGLLSKTKQLKQLHITVTFTQKNCLCVKKLYIWQYPLPENYISNMGFGCKKYLCMPLVHYWTKQNKYKTTNNIIKWHFQLTQAHPSVFLSFSHTMYPIYTSVYTNVFNMHAVERQSLSFKTHAYICLHSKTHASVCTLKHAYVYSHRKQSLKAFLLIYHRESLISFSVCFVRHFQ